MAQQTSKLGLTAEEDDGPAAPCGALALGASTYAGLFGRGVNVRTVTPGPSSANQLRSTEETFFTPPSNVRHSEACCPAGHRSVLIAEPKVLYFFCVVDGEVALRVTELMMGPEVLLKRRCTVISIAERGVSTRAQ
jgi:hypothetical protein